MPFRAASSTGNTSGNNITNPIATLPVSGSGGTVVAGDVAWIFIDAADTGTLTPPAGWTLSESQGLTTDSQPTTAHSTRRYWKALTAGDISGSTVTFTGSGAQRRSVECIVFSGVDNTTPEAPETPAGIGYSTSSSTRGNPSTTLPAARDVIIHAGNRSGTTTTSWTRPGTWVHAIDAFNSGTGGATGSIAYKEALAAGAVGGDTWTASNATTGAVTMLVVVKPTPKSGAATGAVSWSAVATGKRVAKGLATAAIAWVGVASGAVAHRGAATGTDTYSATASGTRVSRSAATGSISWAAVANGTRTSRGAASGALSWTGVATGARTSRGAATGAISWTASATGATVHQGSATGAIAWVGSATGEAPVTGVSEGSATGAVSWSGTASGQRTPKGSATGSTDWSATASGTRASRGSASAAVAWVATAAGSHVSRGAATGAIDWAGSATGVSTHRGAAAGAILWDAVAAGITTPDASIATPERTYRIAAELRVIYVEAEARTYRIPAETRTLEVVQP